MAVSTPTADVVHSTNLTEADGAHIIGWEARGC
jgi:hypothetical protein